MIKYTYGDFPTMEEIKRDYNKLMEIIVMTSLLGILPLIN